MAIFDFISLPTELRMCLREVLIELAERMRSHYIVGYYYFENEKHLSPLAADAFEQVYGFSYHTSYQLENKDKKFDPFPAGMCAPAVS